MYKLKNLKPFYRKSISELESIPASLVLLKCLKPFLFTSKMVGLYPIQISEDGHASFSYFSVSSIFSIFALLFFIGNSSLFMPFYLNVTKQIKTNLANYLAEFIFGMGQYLAGAVTIILIPFMAPHLAKFWNKLQAVVIFSATNGSNLQFARVYRASRIQVFLFVWFTCTYGYVCWYYYNPEIISYYDDDKYIPTVIAFTIFSSTMAYHTLHWFAILSFTSIIQICMSNLIRLIKNLPQIDHKNDVIIVEDESHNNVEISIRSSSVLTEYISIYFQLNCLIRKLGDIYGFYIIGQTIAMITFTVTNVYFLSNFDVNSPKSYLTIMGAIGAYASWLYTICSCGDILKTESKKCSKALILATALQINQKFSMKMHRLISSPVKVSALKFFNVNRKLFTTILGSITTYCVVLFQLKERRRFYFSPPNKRGLEENISSYVFDLIRSGE